MKRPNCVGSLLIESLDTFLVSETGAVDFVFRNEEYLHKRTISFGLVCYESLIGSHLE